MIVKTSTEFNNVIVSCKPHGYIESNLLDTFPMISAISGSWGPFTWDIDYHIDPDDITKCYFKVKLSFYGISIVDTTIDSKNPKVDINLSISGVGIDSALGVDFNARRLYLSGTLNFIVYKKNFDITLLKF